MADVILNTPSEDPIRTPVEGAFQSVTLPADHRPLFLWWGDSIALGNSQDDGTEVFKTIPGVKWPDAAYERTNYGSFWDKRLTTADAGANWSSTGRLTTADNGTQFLQLIPQLGGVTGEVSSTAYASLGTPQTNNVNACPVWSFAQEIYGLFRDSSGNIVDPYFVVCGRASNALGDVVAVNDISTFSPARDGGTNSSWDMLTDGYIRGAIDAVVAASETPIIAGSFTTIGHLDGGGDTMFGGILDGLAPIFADSCTAARRGLEAFMSCEPFPWLHSNFYRPDKNISGNETAYTEIETINDQLRAFAKREEQTAIVEIRDLPRDASNDIHQTPLGIYGMGRRAGQAYRRLLRGTAPVIAREVS